MSYISKGFYGCLVTSSWQANTKHPLTTWRLKSGRQVQVIRKSGFITNHESVSHSLMQKSWDLTAKLWVLIATMILGPYYSDLKLERFLPSSLLSRFMESRSDKASNALRSNVVRSCGQFAGIPLQSHID